MTEKPTIQEALIYVMVTTSAVDRVISDDELQKIGGIVTRLPIFIDFDPNALVKTAKACGVILSGEDNLTRVLDIIAEALPERLHETAYALAIEVAAADLSVPSEEIRFLELLGNRLGLDRLVIAAIERGARARYQQADLQHQ